MTRATLSIWTIYSHPKDYSDGYIAREFEIGPTVVATQDTIEGPLETIRETFLTEMGLTCIPRTPFDDPCIVESWL